MATVRDRMEQRLDCHLQGSIEHTSILHQIRDEDPEILAMDVDDYDAMEADVDAWIESRRREEDAAYDAMPDQWAGLDIA